MSTSVSESPTVAGSSRPLITRIAAAIDGFDEGRDAAALGQSLAEATGSEVMLVAVHSAALLPTPPALSYRSLRQQSELELRAVRDGLAPGARTLTVTDHSVPRALHHVIRRHHRDLLVVGSSRRGHDGRVRIGKRTRQLLCHFECTLAVAPRGLHTNSRRALRRVGVGYDGSPESERALALAASIAAGAAADLHVQAVVDDRVPVFARSALTGVVEVEWDDAISVEIDEIRAHAVAAGERIGAQLDIGVTRGRPADVLLELSEDLDLLVIGSRHWGPAARLLLGSTGEAVMHDAACAVLAVPRPSTS